jgi:hypothetical protein
MKNHYKTMASMKNDESLELDRRALQGLAQKPSGTTIAPALPA